MGELAAHYARLGEIEREMTRLQAQHDVAMSAFKFDEANALQRRIAALEDERRSLVGTLPARSPAVEPPTGIVPVLTRPRRRR
jgi:hypothetical protein